MIDIYAMHFYQNGSMQDNKTLIQTIPASDEGGLYLEDPKVTVKVGNAEGFDFSIQPSTKYYDAFIQMRTYFYVEYDGDLIFYGRVLTIENGFYGEQKIKCEGALSFLNDSYSQGTKEEDRTPLTVGEYISELLTNHNTQVADIRRSLYPGELPGSYTAAVSEDQKIENDSRKFGENGWRQTKAAIEDLSNYYGGMFRIRHGLNDQFYLDWMKHYYRPEINGQIVEVGSNMLDASNITEVNNIFTVVVPIGRGSGSDKLYLSDTYFPVSRVTDFYTDVELNSGYHKASDYREAESRYGKIIKPQEFSEAASEDELLTECAKWVKENYYGGIDEFSVTAVDLHQIGENIQKIMCGDRVMIRFPTGGGSVDERLLTCTAVTYELYSPENNQYTFGIPSSSLKTYGMNSTKSSQDAQNSDQPNYGGTADPPDEYAKWFKGVKNWLTSHRVWWRSTGHTNPPKSWERGDGPTSMDLFLRQVPSQDGKRMYRLFRPTYGLRQVVLQGRTDPDPAFDPILYDEDGIQVKKNVQDWRRDSQGRPICNWDIISEDQLTREKLEANKIFAYVHDEWMYNLTAGMPAEDSFSVTTMITSIFEDPDSGLSVLNNEIVSNLKDIFLGDSDLSIGKILGTSVEKIKISATNGLGIIGQTFTDALGNVKDSAVNFIKDKFNLGSIGINISSGEREFKEKVKINIETGDTESAGNVTADGNITSENGDVVVKNNGVPIRLKDLKLQVINNEEEFGSLVVGNFLKDPTTNTYEPVEYKFSQAIEHYKGGDIVVAKVQGSEVIIGSEHASNVINAALNNISSVCGEFKIEIDPETGARRAVLEEGTGLFMTRDNTQYGIYDSGSLTAGVIVEKFDAISEEERVQARTSLGFYDSGTLTAGVVVEKLRNVSENERVVARTGLGFYDSGTLTGGVLVEKLNDNTTVTQIKGARVDIDASQVKVGSTSNVSAWMTATGQDIDTLEGLVADKATIAQLNAAKARISSLEADNVTITGALSVVGGNIFTSGNINAGLSMENYIRGKTLRLIGSSSSQGAQEATLSYSDIDGMVIKAEVENNTLKLWTHGSSITGNPTITFSKATSLSGSWSGNTYTVTASPQGTTTSIQPYVQPVSSQGGSYVDLYVATGSSGGQGYDTHGTAKKLYLVTSGLTVNLKSENSTSSGSTYATVTCSASHNIDIPASAIYTSDQSRGTQLTTLKTRYEQAKADGDYVMFRVDCGGTSKWYYMNP